ncbi:MAG: flavodoxin domain-containing protein [Immundisolibacterales bacterium]|nr:flavodoxin domain-containing protein [Immundisolibacterales bacterium]
MKRLLVVYHTQTGHTEAMARAVVRGARHPEVAGVEVRLRRAIEAGLGDLLEADAVAIGTPENFGQLSGGMKDFFDRTYYPAQGKLEGLAYAAFISAGNDGRGALEGLRRIVRGYPLREVREPIIARGGIDAGVLERCEELGLALAAGLEAGIY